MRLKAGHLFSPLPTLIFHPTLISIHILLNFSPFEDRFATKLFKFSQNLSNLFLKSLSIDSLCPRPPSSFSLGLGPILNRILLAAAIGTIFAENNNAFVCFACIQGVKRNKRTRKLRFQICRDEYEENRPGPEGSRKQDLSLLVLNGLVGLRGLLVRPVHLCLSYGGVQCFLPGMDGVHRHSLHLPFPWWGGVHRPFHPLPGETGPRKYQF